jgi:hypothetical protein
MDNGKKEVKFYLQNIKASKESPFKMIYSDIDIFMLEENQEKDEPKIFSVTLNSSIEKTVSFILGKLSSYKVMEGYPNGIMINMDLEKGENLRITNDNLDKLKIEQSKNIEDFLYF